MVIKPSVEVSSGIEVAVITTSHIGQLTYSHKWWTFKPMSRWMALTRAVPTESAFSSSRIEVDRCS